MFINKEDAALTSQRQAQLITNKISDDIQRTIWDYKEGRVLSTVYIPHELTNITNTNPIDKTTVLAYMSDIDIGSGPYIDLFGIGAAEASNQTHVGAYIKDGIKYYLPYQMISGETILETFETAEEAARNGFYLDPKFYGD